MNKKYKAFTLAEVLITLAVIGIVAAMSIPSLMNSTGDKELSVARQKAYSTMSGFFNKLNENNELPLSSTTGYQTAFVNLFTKYLNTTSSCNGQFNCWHNINQWYKHNGTALNFSDGYGAVTADGMLISSIGNFVGACSSNPVMLPNSCVHFLVDVNGFKKPNTWGKDIIAFEMTGTQLLPSGAPNAPNHGSFYCNDTDTSNDSYWSNIGCSNNAILNKPIP